MDAETRKKILTRIYRYCSYQDRTRNEVKHKLIEAGVPNGPDLEDWMAYLEEEGMLDEGRYVKSFVRGKFYHKEWGRIKIRNELRKKGVVGERVEAALDSEIPEDEYRKKIRSLIRRKKEKILNVTGIGLKDKIGRFLLQKGYEWGSIVEEIHKVLS